MTFRLYVEEADNDANKDSALIKNGISVLPQRIRPYDAYADKCDKSRGCPIAGDLSFFAVNIPLTCKNILHILIPILNQSAIFVGVVVGFLNV